jgi:hypothetical protein
MYPCVKSSAGQNEVNFCPLSRAMKMNKKFVDAFLIPRAVRQAARSAAFADEIVGDVQTPAIQRNPSVAMVDVVERSPSDCFLSALDALGSENHSSSSESPSSCARGSAARGSSVLGSMSLSRAEGELVPIEKVWEHVKECMEFGNRLGHSVMRLEACDWSFNVVVERLVEPAGGCPRSFSGHGT